MYPFTHTPNPATLCRMSKKTSPARPLAVIVLAAGKGTRMKSAMPKVLHPISGKPMIWHVLRATQHLKPARTLVVTGFGAEQVEAAVRADFPKTDFVRQTEQRGTGHAVMVCEKALKGFKGDVLIVYGDILLNARADVLPTILAAHARNIKGLTMLMADVPDPTGFGRLFKHKGQWVNVEEKDCTPAQKKITTANPCIYMVDSANLFALLAKIKPNNAQNELYLTDIIALAPKHKMTVNALPVAAERPEMGVNNRAELADMEDLMQRRLARQHMLNGVTLLDQHTVYFSADTQIANDVTIGQSVVFGPKVTIERGAVIHAFCHISGSTIRAKAEVGPFARLRSGSDLGEESEVGSFVVTKKAKIGPRTKAKQLNCLVDCVIGADVNVGGGALIANYHHFSKKKMEVTVGDGSSLGANSVLVAPVELGKRSFVAAGTTVRHNIPDNALAVSKAEFIVKKDYAKRKG